MHSMQIFPREMAVKAFKTFASLMIYIICAGPVFAIAEQPLTPVVTIDKGDLQGVVLKTVLKGQSYSSFKGIPYAKPPIGMLRFKPPVEAGPWPGIFKATKEQSECPQKDQISLKFNGSENCLFLNVHTPELEFKKNQTLRAVMVWIHGGSFKSGTGNSHLYGPDFLIEEEMVIVNCNYRLGAFGFMALDHPSVLGNAGLKDQNLVLKWVKRNIASFGGDPDNISLVGESAGGVSADFHVLSKMSEGLFHRSISMSASPLCPWAFLPPDKAKENGFRLATILNNNTEVNSTDAVFKIISKASAYDIVYATETLSELPLFIPTLENPELAKDEEKFMTNCYMENYLSGNYSKVPHLMGFTSKEALVFGKSLDHILEVQKRTMNYLHEADDWFPLVSVLWRIFEKTTHVVTSYTRSLSDEILALASDVFFYTGIDLKERIMHETGVQEIYYYRISFDSSQKSYHQLLMGIHEINGTSHADDLFYLFYVPLAKQPLDPHNSIAITRRRICRMWSNFAKYGNPTPFGVFDPLTGVTWPTSGGLGAHLDIGKQLVVKYKRPIDSNVKIYETITTSEKNLFDYGCTNESLFSALRKDPLSLINFMFSVFQHMFL